MSAGRKARSGPRKLTLEDSSMVLLALEQMEAAVNVGDFGLAHRLLMVIEKIATGTLPDPGRLSEPRGYQAFTRGR